MRLGLISHRKRYGLSPAAVLQKIDLMHDGEFHGAISDRTRINAFENGVECEDKFVDAIIAYLKEFDPDLSDVLSGDENIYRLGDSTAEFFTPHEYTSGYERALDIKSYQAREGVYIADSLYGSRRRFIELVSIRHLPELPYSRIDFFTLQLDCESKIGKRKADRLWREADTLLNPSGMFTDAGQRPIGKDGVRMILLIDEFVGWMMDQMGSPRVSLRSHGFLTHFKTRGFIFSRTPLRRWPVLGNMKFFSDDSFGAYIYDYDVERVRGKAGEYLYNRLHAENILYIANSIPWKI